MKKVKQMLAAAMALVMALSLAACTASPFKNPIATLGDAVVPSEEFYYYYSSLVSSFEDQRQAAFSTFSDEKMDEESGTYFEEVVNYALDLAATQAVINVLFEQRGLELTEEDDAAVQSQIDSYVAAYGSEEAFEQAVADAGMSMDFFKENLYAYQRIDKLTASMAGEEGCTDEDIWTAAQDDFIRVKHILIKTIDDEGQTLDADGIEAAGNQATALVAQLDKGADFDELMAEYGEDPGMVSQPEGYVIDQAVSFDPAFLETAFLLEEGEYDLTLGSSGYHIIKRFPLREEDLESTYFDVYGTGATVRDVLFMEKAENKILEEINAYKENNEIKLDQKELEVLVAYYEEQNPYTPPEPETDGTEGTEGAEGTEGDVNTGGTGETEGDPEGTGSTGETEGTTEGTGGEDGQGDQE